jgi:hypothetical protein
VEHPDRDGSPNLARLIVRGCRFRTETERGREFVRACAKTEEQAQENLDGFAEWARRLAG